MNAIQAWETEGGALLRHSPRGAAASSRAMPRARDASRRLADVPLVAPEAVSGRTPEAKPPSRSSPPKRASRNPKFQNDRAVPEIRIWTKQFSCIGESPPHDHPHVYIDMGDDDTILCPYCATRYRYDPHLAPFEADPEGSLVTEPGGI
jgi:uncharacterized Zn-finger protein